MPEEYGERVFDIPRELPQRPQRTPKDAAGPDGGTRPSISKASIPNASIPNASIPSSSVPAPAAEGAKAASAVSFGGGNWWRVLAESCKGRLSPMYRVFLDKCTGVLEGDRLVVYAPDEITMNRIDNDRVRGVLTEEAAAAAGRSVAVLLRAGEPPKKDPKENLKHLLEFGSQYDIIEIK